MSTRFRKFVASGVVAAALTAAVGGAAFAQTPSASATPAPIQQRAQALVESIASKLGKTPAEVTAAFTAVHKERVAAELAAGRITPEQASQMNQHIESAGGIGFLGGPKGGPGEHRRGGPGPEMRGPMGGAELATFLGVQPQELATAMQSGKTLAQVAQEKGKSRADLIAYLTTQERTRLAQAVTDGRLTQAQADARLSQFSSQVEAMIDRTGPSARGPGGPGKHGRGGEGVGLRGGPGGPGVPVKPGV